MHVVSVHRCVSPDLTALGQERCTSSALTAWPSTRHKASVRGSSSWPFSVFASPLLEKETPTQAGCVLDFCHNSQDSCQFLEPLMAEAAPPGEELTKAKGMETVLALQDSCLVAG